MPTYTFTNTKTGKEFTEMMTIAEMESYLKKNKHIKQNTERIRPRLMCGFQFKAFYCKYQ